MKPTCRTILTVFLIASLFAFAGCGPSAPEGEDILIIGVDVSYGDAVDVASGDMAVGDTNVHDTWVRDIPVYADISGVDMAGVDCDGDEDCPQSGKPCEYVRCELSTYSCVPSNSSKSGDMCDEGWLCRTQGQCEAGVCVYHGVECRDCGDGVCFSNGENCADCPEDCGICPESEAECRDGLDEDYDGDTDCDDTVDCDWDPRCGDWQCVDYSFEDILGCGQSITVEPFGMQVYPDLLACEVEVAYTATYMIQFDSTADQRVTVKLTPGAAGDKFRVFVLEGMCNPEYCVDHGDNNLDAVFDAHDDWSYYLLIDSTSDFAGEVTVEVVCG